jgi:macrolide-specific efflux system membrane fusion protein
VKRKLVIGNWELEIGKTKNLTHKSIAGLLILCVLTTGCGIFGGNSGGKKGQSAGTKTITVNRDDLQITVLATGNVQPKNQLNIKPNVAGRVEQLLVREGQSVKKGQLLAYLSSSERSALLDSARAQGPEELAKWEDLYKPAPLLSPLSGQIITGPVVNGQVVSSADTIMVMSDHLIVNTQVDETDLAQIHAGQKATVTLDAYPGQTISATVKRIAYQSVMVNNVTTYQVEVWHERVPDSMRSGMTANVVFDVAKKEDVLVIPSEAIQQRGDQSIVMMAGVKPTDKPTPQPIQTGITDGKQTEVVSGLNEGDKILIKTFSAGQMAVTNAGTNPFMPGGNTRTGGGGGNRGGGR